jgi:Zn-dependent protease
VTRPERSKRGGGGYDYLGNPSALLAYSIPFGTWFGVRVRLHFWLLVTIAFAVGDMARGHFLSAAIGTALLLLALLIHDFTHKAIAQLVGGRHDQFMLWPAGGLAFPTIPLGPGPMFTVYVGPIVVHGVLALACTWAGGWPWRFLPLNPLAGLSSSIVPPASRALGDILVAFAIENWLLVLINLLPYYWFDGGCLLQSMLWPLCGGYRATSITCVVGMVLAVPMFALSVMAHAFLGMVFWALLFSSSYARRRDLLASGPRKLADAIEQSARNARRSRLSRPSWFGPGMGRTAANRSFATRREQQIDEILAKARARGMHSLTWWERRCLRKANERAGRPDA